MITTRFSFVSCINQDIQGGRKIEKDLSQGVPSA